MHHVSFESLDLKLSVSKYQGTNRVDIIAIKVQSNPRRDKHLLVVQNFFEFYPPRAERKFNQIGPYEDSDAGVTSDPPSPFGTTHTLRLVTTILHWMAPKGFHPSKSVVSLFY